MPFPLKDGGSIALNFSIEGFIEAGVDLSVLAMNSPKNWVDLQMKPQMYERLTYFKAITVDTNIKAVDAFLNLFQSSSYNVNRFISKAYAQELIQLIREKDFDIIQLESLFVTPYISIIRKYSKAKIVIRQHNVEYKIWERLAATSGSFWKRQYLKLLARRLKQHELKYLNEYDLILPISNTDQELLKSLNTVQPIFLHSFGINLKKYPFQKYDPAAEISLYHIGAMDWLPNQESINYFLEKVMPKIRKDMPNLKFYLAGRNMPDSYAKNAGKNVIIAGEVPDARAFEKDKSILVVPLQSGGGVRIKIFEAMALGKAIVTTSIGAEGIEVKDNIHIMIADDPETFVQKIKYLVENPREVQKMGEAARKLIEEKYDQSKIIAALLNRYQELLRTPIQ